MATIKVIQKPSAVELRAQLTRRRNALTALKTPLTRASIFLDQWVQKNFKTEGGHVGGWPPFAESTVKSMDRNDPKRAPAKLLQKTGTLRASFLPFVSGRTAGIGSDLPYARPHHQGEGHLPERRLLPRHREVIKDVNEIMRLHVAQSLRLK